MGNENIFKRAKKSIHDKVEARRTKKQDEKDKVRRQKLEERNTEGKTDTEKKAIEDREVARKEEKKNRYINVIVREKGTPLEKLVQKVDSMGGNVSVSDATRDIPSATMKTSFTASLKQGSQNLGHAIKDKAEDVFSGALEKLKHLNTWADMAGLVGEGSGAVSEASDWAGDIFESRRGESEEEGTREKHNKITGVAFGFLTGLGNSIKFLCNMASEINMLRKGEAGNRDHQERWKAARGYMRDLVGILTDFTGAAGGLVKDIPIFGPILGICSGAVNFGLDVADLISNAVHVESMRKMRDEIYERIQQKRVKYSSGPNEDKEAAAAYTVAKGRHKRSDKVDKQRRLLLEKVYKIEVEDTKGSTTPKAAGGATKLRSKNDSVFRDAQYDLARKIGEKDATEKKTKSEKRQMEALQMMEEFREADKAHKKMSKAVMHNVEDILTGGIAIGLDITALVEEVSGIGAGLALATEGISHAMTATGYVRQGASVGYKVLRTAYGSEANKSTTREDMAISLINKMEDISQSAIWDGKTGVFKPRMEIETESRTSGQKEIVKQGRNVEHLHKILRSGLDASMSDLISSDSKDELKGKIADCFGQG